MNKQSFWDLIKEHGIEIPPIQRDYAQGRHSGRIPVIRSKFIAAVFKKLAANAPLSLDFVYGKIFGQKNEAEQKRNRQSIEALISGIRDYASTLDLNVANVAVGEKLYIPGTATYLIPLDGQQRLTTLFLIHWYIVSRLRKFDELEKLRRFRYKTRKSSEDFIALLCNTDTIDFDACSLEEEICGLESFSNTWLDDPTVTSLLTVVHDIHAFCVKNKIGEAELSNYWNNLAVDGLIQFDFLNLKDFNLSDELYVKMNARGKQLSEFENFKAWLFGKIEHEGWYPFDRWPKAARNFEVEWNDIFWKHKAKDVFEVDNAYFNYFKIQYLIDLVSRAEIKGSVFADEAQAEIIESIRSGAADFDFEAIFDVDFSKRLPVYFDFLDSAVEQLSEKQHDRDISTFANFFFNRRNDLQWIDLLRNYIVSAYLEVNTPHGLDSAHFRNYYRVVKNLFDNQTFDSALLYQRALNEVRTINEAIHASDIFAWLDNLDPQSEGSVFTKEQLQEEKIKGELITADDGSDTGELSWIELLVEAESHWYFTGKVMFLLNLSGLDKKLFKSYFQKVSPLFTEAILSHKEFLVQRSLLTFGNYFIGKGVDRVSFCKNDRTSFRARNENWLLVFSNATRLDMLRRLIDSEKYLPEEVEKSLRATIAEWIDHHPLDTLADHQYADFYIHCHRLFYYGSDRLVRLYCADRYAYPLNSSTNGGLFTDLILEFVKSKFYPTDNRVRVCQVQGWDNDPCLMIGDRTSVITKPKDDLFLISDHEGQRPGPGSIRELLTLIENVLNTQGQPIHSMTNT